MANDQDQAIADLAVERGMVTREQIQEALEDQVIVKGMGIQKGLDAILIDKKWISQDAAKLLRNSVDGGEAPEAEAGAEPAGEAPSAAAGQVSIASLDEPADLKIPGYALLERIGQGAMGEVYKARQEAMGRIVAVKLLLANRASNEVSIQRFQREARATAQLNHPNIIRGIEVGQIQGYHYFVMEFVDGITLAQYLRKKGPLPERRAIRLMIETCQALDHAHQNGFIHRDIKPANIMIDRKRRVKLADLGLVRAVEDSGGAGLTLPGRVLGTPNYMSPEQATNSSEADARSDIFSLGASFYHLLTGRAPFAARSVTAILQNVIEKDPENPRAFAEHLSNRTADILVKMLAKDPAVRYDSARALASELNDHLRDLKRQAKAEADAPSILPTADPQAVEPVARERPLGEGETWPYAQPSESLSVFSDSANPSRIQVLPTPDEIAVAIDRHHRTTERELPHLDEAPRAPSTITDRPPAADPIAPPAAQTSPVRKEPRRLSWLLIGLLLGILAGAVAAGIFKPWRLVPWEKLGLSEVGKLFDQP